MLAGAGLVEGEDYQTVLLDGFDPVAHIAIDGIVGFPGYKSNEPGALDRAGIDYELVRPGRLRRTRIVRRDLHEPTVPRGAADGGPGLRAGDDAWARRSLDDPEAAVRSAFALAEAGGNPSFLSEEGETFRWQTDAELIRQSYAEGEPYGVPNLELLQAEVDAYDQVGLFTEELPELTAVADVDLAASVYDDNAEVIWPQ